jgi:hypothetical protein
MFGITLEEVELLKSFEVKNALFFKKNNNK